MGDLAAHWRMEEGSGAATRDAVGGTDDPFVGGPAWVTAGLAPVPSGTAAALAFDGADDCIAAAYAGVGGSAARTVAFWVRTTDAVGDQHGLVAWGDDTANGAKWHLRLNNNSGNGTVGAIRTEVQGGYIIGRTPLNDGQWHHVVSVFSGDNVDDVVHYVDGVVEGVSGVQSQAVNTDVTGGGALKVSVGRRRQSGSQWYFPGELDDVRIYDHALTAEEARSLIPETIQPPPEPGEPVFRTLRSPAGDHTFAKGLTLTVGPYGTFADARFRAPGAAEASDMARLSSAFLSYAGIAEFLDQDTLGGAAFTASDATSARSAWAFSGLSGELVQEVVETPGGARLIQTATLTNATAEPLTLTLNRYVDAGVLGDGDDLDGAGATPAAARNGEKLAAFDAGVIPDEPSLYVALGAPLGAIPAGAGYQVGPYWPLWAALDADMPLGGTVAGAANGWLLAPGEGDDVALALARRFTLAPGGRAVYRTVTDFGVGTPRTVLAIPPSVTVVTRNVGAAMPDRLESLAFTFSADVAASLDAGDLWLFDDTAGEPVDTAAATLDWEAGTLTGTWDLGGLDLPPGFYTARLSADGVTDANGLPLDGDGDLFPGDDREEPAYVALPGDADLDGQVGPGDLALLRAGMGSGPGATWQEGDFDHDGRVSARDYIVYKRHVAQSVVPEPVAPPPVPATALEPQAVPLAARQPDRPRGAAGEAPGPGAPIAPPAPAAVPPEPRAAATPPGPATPPPPGAGAPRGPGNDRPPAKRRARARVLHPAGRFGERLRALLEHFSQFRRRVFDSAAKERSE